MQQRSDSGNDVLSTANHSARKRVMNESSEHEGEISHAGDVLDAMQDTHPRLGRVAKSIARLRRGRARLRMNRPSCRIGTRARATA